jgi:hypothetical protein
MPDLPLRHAVHRVDHVDHVDHVTLTCHARNMVPVSHSQAPRWSALLLRAYRVVLTCQQLTVE